ncbi:unnamed protein product, partial [Phaeothamnion confervicola]
GGRSGTGAAPLGRAGASLGGRKRLVAPARNRRHRSDTATSRRRCKGRPLRGGKRAQVNHELLSVSPKFGAKEEKFCQGSFGAAILQRSRAQPCCITVPQCKNIIFLISVGDWTVGIALQ